MRFFFTVLLVMSGLSSLAQYRQGEPEPDPLHESSMLDLQQLTSVFIDSSKKLTPDEVLQRRFTALQNLSFSRKIPRALTETSFYLRFSISNPDADSLKGYYYPGMYYRSIALFDIVDGRTQALKLNSDKSSGFIFVTVPPQQTKEFLVKILFTRNDNNVISSKVISPAYLPSFIKQLSTYALARKVFGYIISGALLMMFLFSILNYISLKKQEFLFNALFSLCMFLIIFLFAHYYNTPGKNFGEFFSYWWLILLNTGYIFYIQSTRKFLDTARQHTLIDKFFRFEIIILIILMTVYSLVHFFSSHIMWDYYLENAMKVIVVGISFVYIILGLENKKRLMNYLALGNAFQVICAVTALSLIPISANSTKMMTSSFVYFEIGVFVSQLFFLLGLTYKNRTELIDEFKYRQALRLNEEKAAYETKLAIIEAKQAERNRISTDMHDDLGSGMTTIRMYSELAKRKLGNQAIPEIEKISSSANALLVKMNAIIWSMADSNDTLDNMVAYIRSYALEFFENTGIDCRVAIPDNLPKLEVNGEIRRNVFLVVKEALNNVLKHSEATQVDIRLNKEPQGFSLSIHDNGKGIDFENVRAFSNGLQNMKKRMDDIGGELSILNYQGTTIRLYKKTRD